MRVLVSGGRAYANRDFLYERLDVFRSEHGIDLIIHGGARGADSLAGVWAKDRGIDTWCFLAEWNRHGKRAGFIRNRKMLVDGRPDVVMAFPGGKGTAMMVGIAHDAGVEVVDLREE